jgi:hypothetical protein
MTRPIEIPSDLIADRAVRQLITAWKHSHERFRVCERRVHWGTAAATKIEKKRRREKWQCVARILEIERTMLRWCAKATHHPDIWMSKKLDAKESKLHELESAYYRNRRLIHGATGLRRATGMREREALVRQIRSIRRQWMVAVLTAVAPESHIPNALPLHPRELLPRKIARASKDLLTELV